MSPAPDPSADRPDIATRMWRAWLALCQADDPALSPRHRRAVLLIASFAPVAVAAFWGYAVFYLAYDAANLWPASLVCLSGTVFAAFPGMTRRNVIAGCVAIAVCGSAIFAALCFLFGAGSGLYLGMITGAILVTLIMGTTRPVTLALIIGPPLVLGFVLPILFPRPGLDGVTPELQSMILQSNVLALLALTMTALFLAVRRIEEAETALEAEHARSEALLYNLLPEKIAARLKRAPDRTIADSLPRVAILFADIVDFTPRAARMTPEEVVAFLNRIFSAFDALAEKHGLEKIKTIGDAYMVAAGKPDPCDDPVHRVAGMALDMLEVTAALPDGVEVRIGLHAGPAVAGVIGNRKLFYDVWGETVNTASRMESHGAAGRIQVTAAVRDALGEDFRCAPRGVVEVKSVGPVETWWLLGGV